MTGPQLLLPPFLRALCGFGGHRVPAPLPSPCTQTHTHPLFFRMAARWLVLFPGAAQASMMWEPAAGPRRKAGRQLACKRANPTERCRQQAPPAPPWGTAKAAGSQAATATQGPVHHHHQPPPSLQPCAPPSCRCLVSAGHFHSLVQSNSSQTCWCRGTPPPQAAVTLSTETSSAAAKPAQAQPTA